MIERLIEEKIPFAILVARVYGKSVSDNYSGLHYSLICDLKHLKRLRELKRKDGNFTFTRDSYSCVSHNMRTTEIRDFKDKQHLFKKVLHCEHGRVYELK